MCWESCCLGCPFTLKIRIKKTIYLKCIIKYLSPLIKYSNVITNTEARRAELSCGSTQATVLSFVYAPSIACQKLMTSLKLVMISARREKIVVLVEKIHSWKCLKIALSHQHTATSAILSHRFFTCGGARSSTIGWISFFSAFHPQLTNTRKYSFIKSFACYPSCFSSIFVFVTTSLEERKSLFSKRETIFASTFPNLSAFGWVWRPTRVVVKK